MSDGKVGGPIEKSNTTWNNFPLTSSFNFKKSRYIIKQSNFHGFEQNSKKVLSQYECIE